jgi:iron complex outermembrane receptor protein
VGRSSIELGETTHRLMLGADEAYQDGSIQFYALTNNSRGALTDNKGEGAQNTGVFLQDEFTALNDRLSLVVGARYDRVAYNYRTFFDPNAAVKKQTKDFDRVSPKLGVSWRLGSLGAVYGNIGGGIEVPAGNETDQPPTAGSAAPVPGALLNPLLDAISSTTYEIGYKTLGWSVAEGAATIGGDVALYHTRVANEIIPYNGGRYYQTAASARRNGIEVGLNGTTRAGVFANASVSWNDHTYHRYVVDSSVINVNNTGTADLSGHQVMGVPKVFGSADVGTEVPGYRNLRFSFGVEHSGKYFADDRNAVVVPSYTTYNLTAALRNPIFAANGVTLRGFVQLRNLTDTRYVGSAFLNPDLNADGEPMVYEPGAPRSLTVSFSLGHK